MVNILKYWMWLSIYRLHILKQPADLKTETELLSIWTNVSDPSWTCGQTKLSQLTTTSKFLMLWRINETEYITDGKSRLVICESLY
jgi:hypothetical protein